MFHPFFTHVSPIWHSKSIGDLVPQVSLMVPVERRKVPAPNGRRTTWGHLKKPKGPRVIYQQFRHIKGCWSLFPLYYCYHSSLERHKKHSAGYWSTNSCLTNRWKPFPTETWQVLLGVGGFKQNKAGSAISEIILEIAKQPKCHKEYPVTFPRTLGASAMTEWSVLAKCCNLLRSQQTSQLPVAAASHSLGFQINPPISLLIYGAKSHSVAVFFWMWSRWMGTATEKTAKKLQVSMHCLAFSALDSSWHPIFRARERCTRARSSLLCLAKKK